MSDRKRILVTGCAGRIGRSITPHLRACGHWVRGFDRHDCDLADEMHTGELTDAQAVGRAMAGVDTVVHLAACPRTRADFLAELLEPNVLGLYHVFDQAQAAGVDRLVLASSCQVVHGYGFDTKRVVGVADAPAPKNHYGVTKLWAEDMGRLYARTTPMTVFAARIGWYPLSPRHLEILPQYECANSMLSHDDARRFFASAVACDRPAQQFHIFFAVSRQIDASRLQFDMAPARRVIGYEPRDEYPHGCSFDED